MKIKPILMQSFPPSPK